MVEIKIGDKLLNFNLIEKNEGFYKIEIDGREYDIDVMKIKRNIYSVINQDKSYYIELFEKALKNYEVNIGLRNYVVEIIDSESRYLKNRNSSNILSSENVISSPMSGKIVKILVNEGDAVDVGQSVIVISAMKMESHYKSNKKGTIKSILVKEGDTTQANQSLIIID